MLKKLIVVVGLFATPVLSATFAMAQGAYPSTQYRGFYDNQNFATSRPRQVDGVGNDYRAMSPDSWETAGDPNASVAGCPPLPNSAANGNVVGCPPTQGAGSSGPGCPPPAERGNDCQCNSSSPGGVAPPNGSAPSSVLSGNGQFSGNEFQPPLPKGDEPDIRSSAASPESASPFHKASHSPRPAQTNEQELPNSPSVPENIRYQKTDVETPNKYPSPSPRNPMSGINPVGAQPTAFPRSPPTSLVSHPKSILRSPVDPIPNPPTQPPVYSDSVLIAPSSNLDTRMAQFRGDVGQRDAQPTLRNLDIEDYGQKYDFEEKKKEYPPMKEILATGRYFGSATTIYLKPSFQGNTAITEPASGVSTPFDFDYEADNQFQVGFESKYGPGIELNYWQYDESSNVASFTSDGIETGTNSVWMMGPYQWSRLTAANNGETLDAIHSIDVESIGVNFFKGVQLPISRITGKFGFQFASIGHVMDATLTDGGGTQIGNLRTRSDLNAYGPQLKMEYYRPVGHTKMEFMTSCGGSVMFGKRDQFVTNSATGDFSRVGADEFVTMFDFMSGVQYRKMLAENRYWFVRGGVMFQTWLNGGTAAVPQDDFGLRGFTFSIGLNR